MEVYQHLWISLLVVYLREVLVALSCGYATLVTNQMQFMNMRWAKISVGTEMFNLMLSLLLEVCVTVVNLLVMLMMVHTVMHMPALKYSLMY